MPCSRMADGTALTCTATYRKRTGQPRSVAGSKNPLPLGMGGMSNSTTNVSNGQIKKSKPF